MAHVILTLIPHLQSPGYEVLELGLEPRFDSREGVLATPLHSFFPAGSSPSLGSVLVCLNVSQYTLMPGKTLPG